MIQNDISLLRVTTQNKVRCFLDIARSLGLDVFVFESLRTQERQEELFGYGRTATALKKYGVPEKYAKPKEKQRTRTLSSQHLVGRAVDVVFDANKDPKIKAPSWNGNYKKLIEIGKVCGLRNLAPIETCHFEDDGRKISDIIVENGKLRHQAKSKEYKDLLHKANTLLREVIAKKQ